MRYNEIILNENISLPFYEQISFLKSLENGLKKGNTETSCTILHGGKYDIESQLKNLKKYNKSILDLTIEEYQSYLRMKDLQTKLAFYTKLIKKYCKINKG